MLKDIPELHTDHRELDSEISFLKIELNFLLKLLNREYSHSINNEKIKLLDNYYVLIEKNIEKLDVLAKEVKKEEKNLAAFSHNKPEGVVLPEKSGLTEEYYRISKEIRVVKESFYNYLIQR